MNWNERSAPGLIFINLGLALTFPPSESEFEADLGGEGDAYGCAGTEEVAESARGHGQLLRARYRTRGRA